MATLISMSIPCARRNLKTLFITAFPLLNLTSINKLSVCPVHRRSFYSLTNFDIKTSNRNSLSCQSSCQRSIVKGFNSKCCLQRQLKVRTPPEPMPPGRTKIAVVQLTSFHEVEDNLLETIKMIKRAAEKDATMVFFPEAFDFICLTKEKTIELAETLDGPIMTRFKESAVQYNVWLSLGGFHERQTELKEDGTPWVTNTHVLINPEGKIVNTYRKIHLFDVDIKEQNIHLHESGYVKPGDTLVVTDMTPIGRIGLGICYDLRFPEFSMALRHHGAHVLTYPSAFTSHTGKAHWLTLLKARAIETQCYVVAAAQYGRHNIKRVSYGHSMVIDPWGNVLADGGGSGTGVTCAEIDLSFLEKIRREMPVFEHKVPGILSTMTQPAQAAGSETSVDPPADSPLYEIPFKGNAYIFHFGDILVKSEIVFLESPYSRAFVNKRCIVQGHVLVSPKRLVHRMRDLAPAEVSDLFCLVQKVEEIMISFYGADAATIAVQDGKHAGQTVKHVHVHVLPRRKGDFKKNDDIYERLAKHDNDAPSMLDTWRNEKEMIAESSVIQKHIREKYGHLIKPQSEIKIPPPVDPTLWTVRRALSGRVELHDGVNNFNVF